MGGQKKRPLFQKPEKMGNLKKKNGGMNKPVYLKKMGERLVGAKKYSFFFKKKRKIGRKWAQGENPPFSKNGHKTKTVGAPTVFLTKKKARIFLRNLCLSEIKELF